MFPDLFAAHPGLYAAALLSYSLLEYWLGKTPSTPAGSVIELIMLGFDKLFGRKPMPIIDTTTPVAKELQEVLDLALALARDMKAGVKPADIAGKELSKLMAAITDSDKIPAEYAANPEVFAQTLGGGLARLAAILLAPTAPKA